MTRSKTTTPTPWSLGGEPPEPQKVEAVKPIDADTVVPAHTHTGTDPLGRAIGPREDHLHVKRVRNGDGEIVKPYTEKVGTDGKTTRRAIDTRAVEKAAADTAAATDTKAEGEDDPKPFTPAAVAKAHEEGAVLIDPDDESA